MLPVTFIMTTLFQDLQSLGLTANQSQVYLTLARSGPSKAGEVIKKTGLHRNLVYVALQELIEKKLVSQSKVKGIAVYKTLSPSRLLAEPEEKERLAKGVIEELTLLSKKTRSGQEIVIYEGIEEFRRYEENLYNTFKPKSLIRYLGLAPLWQKVVGENLEDKLIAIQSARGVKMHALAHTITQGQQDYVDKAKGLVTIRTNPLISSDTNNTVILDDRISLRSFVEPFFVVEIVNEALAKNHQNYFDFLWKNSK